MSVIDIARRRNTEDYSPAVCENMSMKTKTPVLFILILIDDAGLDIHFYYKKKITV